MDLVIIILEQFYCVNRMSLKQVQLKIHCKILFEFNKFITNVTKNLNYQQEKLLFP